MTADTIDRNSTAAGDFTAARKAMIDSQLRPSDVNDPLVLGAMNSVSREQHVPAAMRGAAYGDRAVKLDNGRYLASPLFYGRMLVEAQPRVDDTVLIVDAGSGYLPALVEPYVSKATVVDPEAAISLKRGKFSLILIDGAVEAFPDSLTKRVSENGRIVTGLVSRGVQRLALGNVVSGKASFLPILELGIPVLSEFAAKKEWSF